jgi:hypothetical protein
VHSRTRPRLRRDAKAEAALARRRGVPCRNEIVRGIELTHNICCNHLLGLIAAVAENAPEQHITSIIAAFVQRTTRLAAVMNDVLRPTQGGTPIVSREVV